MVSGLYCGDTIEVMRTLPDASVDLVLCDLPYGTTAQAWDKCIDMDALWAEYARLLAPHGTVALFCVQPFTSELVKHGKGGGGVKRAHPNEKPVELLRYLIRTYTDAGDVVLDNTMGSGSTCVAAVMEERRYIGIERDERYYETARRRVAEAEEAYREREGAAGVSVAAAGDCGRAREAGAVPG